MSVIIPTGHYTTPVFDRTITVSVGELSIGAARRTTDPIGSAYVTFSGVKPQSEIRVFQTDGTELAGVESCSENQQLIWSAYANGNPLNDVVIRIIHADYKLIELPYSSTIGVIAIPIQQQRDKWYSNPV